MKRIILLSLGILTSILVFAQKPEADFAKTKHNFGKINEADGKVSCIFEVTNTGDAALLLTQVQTSCGCTAREYTKQPILPGEKGEVKVTYDPKGRPGPFKKTITVSNNSKNDKIILSIKGEVIPKELETENR